MSQVQMTVEQTEMGQGESLLLAVCVFLVRAVEIVLFRNKLATAASVALCLWAKYDLSRGGPWWPLIQFGLAVVFQLPVLDFTARFILEGRVVVGQREVDHDKSLRVLENVEGPIGGGAVMLLTSLGLMFLLLTK